MKKLTPKEELEKIQKEVWAGRTRQKLSLEIFEKYKINLGGYENTYPMGSVLREIREKLKAL